MKLTSGIIKTLLMHKLRFKDGSHVTSEVTIVGGSGTIADLGVLDYSTDEFYEIEIKISKSDLKRDIIKPKHREYCRKDTFTCLSKFYYAVPTSLVDEAIGLIEDNKLPYGVIEIVSDKNHIPEDTIAKLSKHNFVYSDLIRVVKRAKKISNNKISKTQKSVFFRRMSSELVTYSRRTLDSKLKLMELKVVN